MLLITTRAEQELRKIVEKEGPGIGVGNAASGVRLVLSSSRNNGTQGNRCMIGTDHERIGDQVEDVGGINLLIDPSTLAYLSRINAILDFRQMGSEKDLVLMIEGS